MTEEEINFVRNIPIEQLTEIRMDIVSVDYADKLAEHKNEQIEKMRNCPNCNKKGCNLEIAKRKECIDNNNSLWEWELAE